ncbi:TPA: hypothetical protein ACGUMU_003423 [Vibrio vulnificus]|uniref:hypothetical protein n=1 Tax=Vibrio vulnificus TaxID=672 RepID=UPI0032ECBD76
MNYGENGVPYGKFFDKFFVMSLTAFKNEIRSNNPKDLALRWFSKSQIHAIGTESDYLEFKSQIRADYPNATDIAVMGSGNWGFSLSPHKRFKSYDSTSDIDVAIISDQDFNSIWDDIREYHRQNYYAVSYDNKQALLRNGQNVYSGFVTPKWNPNIKSSLRHNYELNTNKYSSSLVGYKPVNMMFFKNIHEVVDYYVRGIRLAKVDINGI